MHRSGTSLLTSILEEFGVFMGAVKETNREASFFLHLNGLIFERIGASWDNPKPKEMEDIVTNGRINQQVKRILKSPLRIFYLGWKNYFKVRQFERFDIPWGWKDPRNTFTIKFWKNIFPDLKIIHIYRHPMDVAQSMRVRESKKKDTRGKVKNIVRRILKIKGVSPSVPRLMDINAGIQLWENYVSMALSLDKSNNNRIFHIKYEDLLKDPVPILKQLMGFANVKINNNELDKICRNINPDRRFSFKKNTNLVKLYETIKDHPMLIQLGYHQIAAKSSFKK